MTLLLKTYACLLILSVQSSMAAGPAKPFADQVLTVYHSLSSSTISSMPMRLDAISARFLGLPYERGALGDGPHSHYDEAPLYQLDTFDCETYVTTVLALSLASDVAGFKRCLQKIRYKNGKVGYLTRNHFTSEDWNKGNQTQGFIKDITDTIKNAEGEPIALFATALINKPAWYAYHGLDTIRLTKKNKDLQQQRLLELKALGSSEPRVVTRIAYLPLARLFDKKGQPDLALFKQIPNASIIEIVRPNWDLRKIIGTELNVSHLGFAFWKGSELIFRQASQEMLKVVDVSLISYLQQTLTSPTIKGINIQVLVPEKPGNCL